jgi:PAS domain S-box-containing protein
VPNEHRKPAAGDQLDQDRTDRRRTVVLAAVLLVAAITALRLAANEADEPITVLYVIPVALLAAEFGVGAGMASALFCFGLYVVAILAADIQMTFFDDVLRLVVLLSVGLVVGLVGARLRRALEDLERSSVVLRTVGEATPDVIYAKDPSGRYMLMNTAGAAFSGVTPADIIGKYDQDLTEHDAAKLTRELDLRAVEQDEIIETTRTIRLEGEEVTFSGYVGPLRAGNGDLLGVFGVARDVTVQVRMEASREVYLNAIRVVAAAPEPEELGARLLDTLVDGKIIRAGRRLPDGTGEGGRGARAAEGTVVLPLMAAGHDFGTLELEIATHGDSGAAATTLIEGVGAMVGQYLERRVAEREAERIKNEFFGLVSHELRSPLTSIVGYSELLAEVEADRLSTQGKGFIEVIDRNARRQLRLVQDLLLLSRLDGGRFTLDLSESDLRSVVEEACEAVGPQAAGKNVELDLDLEDVGPARCDAVRLGQAVDNLLTNAIKFSPEGGSVSISLTGRDGVARIEVADSGIGVAADEVDRLFDRLFRASSAVEQQIQGTGLGLTIVKAVVEGHGGRVAVESELGRGTTFTLELPVLIGDQDGRPAPPPTDLEGQLR